MMTTAHSTRGVAAGLELDPAKVRLRAAQLLSDVEAEPKKVEERQAAAEAHVRLVVLGLAGDDTRKLLDRAMTLDPYRATTFLVSAILEHREGFLGRAIPRYESAAMLAPDDIVVRFHAGFGFLDAARQRSLSDEESAELAEVAADHFEAVLRIDPHHKPGLLGAVESAIYGKPTKLRETVKRVFARVPVEAALRPTVTRLLLQAVFAFRVGKAKNVDQKNKKTMADIVEVTQPWLAAFPGDEGLKCVLAAAGAKCESGDELCDRIATHVKEIGDVRVLRLLLRERLADVADPRKRVALFDGIMSRIPALDGIAHDYLQLKHLVAKRSVAEGEVESARSTWLECEKLDPYNAQTKFNLLRLAAAREDSAETARLEAEMDKLGQVHVALGPRPDLVLRQKAAVRALDCDIMFSRVEQALQQDKRPTVDQIFELTLRWIHTMALHRMAVEPELLERMGRHVAADMLGGTTQKAIDLALEVLRQPLTGALPLAYAYLELPKDVAQEVLEQVREAWANHLHEVIRQGDEMKQDTRPYLAFLQRGIDDTRILLDPAIRAEYDALTGDAERAEFYRRYVNDFRFLLSLGRTVFDQVYSKREQLASLLAAVPRDIMTPLLEMAPRNLEWVGWMLLHIHYGGSIARAWKLLEQGYVDQARTVCVKELEGAQALADTQALLSRLVLEDAQVPLWEAVDRALQYARNALDAAYWMESMEGMTASATTPPEVLAMIAASRRCEKVLDAEQHNEAARLLATAYPGMRGKQLPNVYPAARFFVSLPPNGTTQYAFTVAHVIRESIIRWFNEAQPRTQREALNLRNEARNCTISAAQWATYAHDRVRNDPNLDKSPVLQGSLNATRKLIALLQNDLAALR